MNWDDLRFVLALSRAGSLARAARELKVDHTTVGRRIEAVEAGLGVKLFTRTSTGYLPTAEAERLLPDIELVEASVLALQRGLAHQNRYQFLLRVHPKCGAANAAPGVHAGRARQVF